jgi:hypothetical protein
MSLSLQLAFPALTVQDWQWLCPKFILVVLTLDILGDMTRVELILKGWLVYTVAIIALS